MKTMPAGFSWDEWQPDPRLFAISNRLLGSLQAVTNHPELAVPAVFGLELRTAHALLNATQTEATLQKRLRRLFLRPAIEPILHSYLIDAARSLERLSDSADLVSALTGTQTKVRDTPMFTQPFRDRQTRFLDADQIEAAWAVRGARTPEDGLLWAARRYLDALQIHPFKDGNGRLARALLCQDLGRLAGCQCLYLPLAPLHYQRSSPYLKAFSAIIECQDHSPFFAVFLDTVSAAIRPLAAP